MAALNDKVKIRGTEDGIITYGGVDYPVVTLGDTTITPEMVSGTMSGELGKKVDQFSFFTGETGMDLPQMLLDAKLFGILTGNPVTEAGAAPNQTTTLDYKAGVCLEPFALKLKSSCVGNTSGYGTGNTVAQTEFQFYNVMLVGKAIAVPQAEFMSVTGTYRCVCDAATDKFMSLVLRETAV